MSHITVGEAKAWTEPTKVGADFAAIEDQLEKQVSSNIIGRLSSRFDTRQWTNDQNTPQLIRTVIAMYYVSHLYDRTYSTGDPNISAYAELLRSQADNSITLLIDGTIDLPEEPDNGAIVGDPAFFPNDASSANEATSDNPSDGGPKFLMGTIW